MRRLYDEFFYVPQHGKIREKVMLTRTAVMVSIMIICLAVMSITAYAYFSSNTTVRVNTVQAADFDLNITVTNESNEPLAAAEDEVYTLTSGKYTVKLNKTGTANTGFCVMERSDNTTVYHTEQLGISGASRVDSISFTLDVTNTVSVKFTPHWGTSYHYGYENNEDERYIRNNGTLHIVSTENINSISETNEKGTTLSQTPPRPAISTTVSSNTVSAVSSNTESTTTSQATGTQGTAPPKATSTAFSEVTSECTSSSPEETTVSSEAADTVDVADE